MWIIIFVTLFLVGGTNSFSSECMQDEREICAPLAHAFSFPENAEEITEKCRDFQELGKCVLSRLENCNEDERYINVVKKVLDYAKNTCDPENDIYKVIKDNFECVMPALGQFELCISIYEELLSDNRTLDHCASFSWEIACQAFSVSLNCGEESSNAVLDILMHGDFNLLFYCTDEEIQTIPALVESFKLFANMVGVEEDKLSRKK